MKSTGIVRRIDELGRIVLPIEIRKTLDLSSKDAVEIFVDGNSIILEKYEPTCIFCGSAEKTQKYEGKRICSNCLENLKKVELQPEEEEDEEKPKSSKKPKSPKKIK